MDADYDAWQPSGGGKIASDERRRLPDGNAGALIKVEHSVALASRIFHLDENRRAPRPSRSELGSDRATRRGVPAARRIPRTPIMYIMSSSALLVWVATGTECLAGGAHVVGGSHLAGTVQ